MQYIQLLKDFPAGVSPWLVLGRSRVGPRLILNQFWVSPGLVLGRSRARPKLLLG